MPTLFPMPWDRFKPIIRVPPQSQTPGNGSGQSQPPLTDIPGMTVQPKDSYNQVTIPYAGAPAPAAAESAPEAPAIPDFESDMQRKLYEMFVNRAGYFRGLSGTGREIPGFEGTSPDVLLLQGGGMAYGNVAPWTPKPAAPSSGGGGGGMAALLGGGGSGGGSIPMSIPGGEYDPSTPRYPLDNITAKPTMETVLRDTRRKPAMPAGRWY